MQALVYTRPLEMQMQEHPAPALVAGEVVLRIDAVGICGSDMHAYHGHDPRRKPGLVLGHEFAGTIAGGALLDLVPAEVLVPLLAVLLIISARKVWQHG